MTSYRKIHDLYYVVFWVSWEEKGYSSSQLGICYAGTANRRDVPVHQSFLFKQLIWNTVNLSKCIEKSDFSTGQLTWQRTQKWWRWIRKIKQNESGPEMDEREWKFPKLSEPAQHKNMSQLLPSLGHYLFIDSMNEVDWLESLTSLFVKSALEDFLAFQWVIAVLINPWTNSTSPIAESKEHQGLWFWGFCAQFLQ